METTAGAVASAVKMMKKTIIFLRGFPPFALGCFITLNAKSWLSTWWGVHLSYEAYSVVACIIISISNYLTVSAILSAFRSDPFDITNFKLNETPKTYRYSYFSVCRPFILSIILPAAGFIIDNPNKPIPLQGHLITFAPSIFCLIYTLFRVKFRIKIYSTELIISLFSTKKFSTKDITKVFFANTRGRCTVITLNNGEKFSIDGALKNYYQMVDTLAACVGRGRWTSNDRGVNKHFKEVAYREILNEKANNNSKCSLRHGNNCGCSSKCS